MKKEIKEYFAVSAENPIDMNKCVSALIEDGWQPFGSLGLSQAVSPLGNFSRLYTQAMVKYKKKESCAPTDEAVI